nr:hypothetical protein [Aeromonas sp. 159]
MAIALARGLSPEAHAPLCQSMNERQKQLDEQAAKEQKKPVSNDRWVL